MYQADVGVHFAGAGRTWEFALLVRIRLYIPHAIAYVSCKSVTEKQGLVTNMIEVNTDVVPEELFARSRCYNAADILHQFSATKRLLRFGFPV